MLLLLLLLPLLLALDARRKKAAAAADAWVRILSEKLRALAAMVAVGAGCWVVWCVDNHCGDVLDERLHALHG